MADQEHSSMNPHQPQPVSSARNPLNPRKKSRRGKDLASQKRRCVSTACVACRKRKSKCDGALPSCAACSSVYGTECVYDPNSDHRRKGVYREKVDAFKAQNATLKILIEAILTADEDDVAAIVRRIRTCDDLDAIAQSIASQELFDEGADDHVDPEEEDHLSELPVEGERELARKMGELRLENGAIRYIGGTSHLIYLGDPGDVADELETETETETVASYEDPITSWSHVTKDQKLIVHLLNMYFTWHYPYFTTLSKVLFYRDFSRGNNPGQFKGTVYCTSLLVNAMLALGCHFTDIASAYAVPEDSRTKGDHFFAEAKRLIVDNDEYEKPRLATVQALALMSVREAGCGREAKGWVYSGMSFRMAQDIGLNLDTGGMAADGGEMSEHETDARRITFWGCFLFDKCWSNYLGRLPQIPKNSYNVPKYDVFPDEDAEPWSAYSDIDGEPAHRQPSRTRAVALQLSKLCEISSDLLLFFYHPNHIGRSSGKAVELKKLSDLQRRLEEWRKELPREFEPKDGQLPPVILMHMFFHLQYIHLFRPFLKYAPSASPLPSHVSPRRICTANAGAISKLMRLYKKLYNLRQICNIAVYMLHSACTIHLLNLPEKNARRDITHGVKNLEEMAEDWPCARRTLCIISVLARKWKVELPEEAAAVLQRTDEKYGTLSTSEIPSPNRPGGSANSSPAAVAAGSASVSSSSKHPSISPAARYTQISAQPPGQAASLPPTSMPITTTTTMPSLAQSPSLVTTGSLMTPVMPVTEAMPMSSPWGMPDLGQTASLPLYQQAYTPIHTALESSTGSPTAGQRLTPTSMFAVDGREWYLKDSVNWQQNFQSWGLSSQPSHHPGSAAPEQSQSMFIFSNGEGLGGQGFVDGFGNAMGGLDQLSGLE